MGQLPDIGHNVIMDDTLIGSYIGQEGTLISVHKTGGTGKVKFPTKLGEPEHTLLTLPLELLDLKANVERRKQERRQKCFVFIFAFLYISVVIGTWITLCWCVGCFDCPAFPCQLSRSCLPSMDDY